MSCLARLIYENETVLQRCPRTNRSRMNQLDLSLTGKPVSSSRHVLARILLINRCLRIKEEKQWVYSTVQKLESASLGNFSPRKSPKGSSTSDATPSGARLKMRNLAICVRNTARLVAYPKINFGLHIVVVMQEAISLI